MKILIVTDSTAFALGNCFIRAGKKLGYEIATFDLAATEKKYVKFGNPGLKIHTFWPVEAWQRKANRELIIAYRKLMPDVIMVVGNIPVLFGTLAFFKSLGKGKTVLYWPDTLLNLTSFQKDGASLYDLVATYSSTSMHPFHLIGYKNTHFMPFAGDKEFLGEAVFSDQFDYDLSFAGGYRPEREAALAAVISAFPDLKILIKGTDWERFCKNKQLLKSCDPKPIYGKDFGDFIRRSRINLNVIDDTNYPAANMRFFEIPGAGGLQLSSVCPEMETTFTDRNEILYFTSEKHMIEQIRWVLDHSVEADQIRRAANSKIEKQHTYLIRFEALIKALA